MLTCSGGNPGALITGNLTLFLSVNITNRLAASNTVAGVIFTADNGSGPQPINAAGMLTAPGTLVYNGASFMLSSTGSVTLRIANIRAEANQTSAFPSGQIGALLSFSSMSPVGFSNTQQTVATPQPGLYDGFSSKIVCSQSGSPLPANPASFASFIAKGSVFNTTRVTEGFADAFSPLSGFQGLNAGTGTRFLVSYSGFPAGARIFRPDRGGWFRRDATNRGRQFRPARFRWKIHTRWKRFLAAVAGAVRQFDRREWNATVFARRAGIRHG